MMCQRELETPIAWVGLELSLPQRHLAITVLDCDQHLESMTGSSGRLQLRGSAPSCIRLVEFSADEKNASQIILWRIGKRIQIHCLTSLFLRLIEFTQIHDDAREEIVRSRICGRNFFCAL